MAAKRAATDDPPSRPGEYRSGQGGSKQSLCHPSSVCRATLTLGPRARFRWAAAILQVCGWFRARVVEELPRGSRGDTALPLPLSHGMEILTVGRAGGAADGPQSA